VEVRPSDLDSHGLLAWCEREGAAAWTAALPRLARWLGQSDALEDKSAPEDLRAMVQFAQAASQFQVRQIAHDLARVPGISLETATRLVRKGAKRVEDLVAFKSELHHFERAAASHAVELVQPIPLATAKKVHLAVVHAAFETWPGKVINVLPSGALARHSAHCDAVDLVVLDNSAVDGPCPSLRHLVTRLRRGQLILQTLSHLSIGERSLEEAPLDIDLGSEACTASASQSSGTTAHGTGERVTYQIYEGVCQPPDGGQVCCLRLIACRSRVQGYVRLLQTGDAHFLKALHHRAAAKDWSLTHHGLLHKATGEAVQGSQDLRDPTNILRFLGAAPLPETKRSFSSFASATAALFGT